ncbi:hypothetical protein EJ08DRAFT_343865 [Tothia fuscella]|uniref:Uncharacterized protein n=1 Tax=Tothia fuscella TaxID=1048955 RepID=A0A9P4P2Q2_9PEZI|nr:hypothetical protein EJ08DRAFT_343865 [Tothia fuscella]
MCLWLDLSDHSILSNLQLSLLFLFASLKIGPATFSHWYRPRQFEAASLLRFCLSKTITCFKILHLLHIPGKRLKSISFWGVTGYTAD